MKLVCVCVCVNGAYGPVLITGLSRPVIMATAYLSRRSGLVTWAPQETKVHFPAAWSTQPVDISTVLGITRWGRIGLLKLLLATIPNGSQPTAYPD